MSLLLLALLAHAADRVVLVLPPGESPAAWATAARLGGLTVGGPQVGALVELRAEGGRWSVHARDSLGNTKSMRIEAPGTSAEREDAVWLAVSLLEGLPRPPELGGRGGVEGVAERAPAPRERSPTPSAPGRSELAAVAVPAAAGRPTDAERTPSGTRAVTGSESVTRPGGTTRAAPAPKPAEPATRPAEPATRPAEPATRPAEPAGLAGSASSPGVAVAAGSDTAPPDEPAQRPPQAFAADAPPVGVESVASGNVASGNVASETVVPQPAAAAGAVASELAPEPIASADAVPAEPVAPSVPAPHAPVTEPVAADNPAPHPLVAAPLHAWARLGPAVAWRPATAAAAGFELTAGIELGSVWLGAQATWLTPRSVHVGVDGATMGSTDVALGAWWSPAGRRIAPVLGGSAGVSARRYDQDDEPLSAFLVTRLGADAGATLALSERLSLVGLARATVDVNTTHLERPDGTTERLSPVQVDGAVTLRARIP